MEKTASSSTIWTMAAARVVRARPPKTDLRGLRLDLVLDLGGGLPDQEQPARDQDQVTPGERGLEAWFAMGIQWTGDAEVDDRRGQADDPGDGAQQRQPQHQREADADAPGERALRLGQVVGHDGDEDEVVDPEDDFHGHQRKERGPGFGRGEEVEHQSCPSMRGGRRQAAVLVVNAAGVVEDPDHAVEEPELAGQGQCQSGRNGPGVQYCEAPDERWQTEGRKGGQEACGADVVCRDRGHGMVEPDPLAHHRAGGPAVGSGGWREGAGVEPGPGEQGKNGDQAGPADPDPRPDHQRQQGQDRQACPDAQGVGVPLPDGVGHGEAAGDGVHAPSPLLVRSRRKSAKPRPAVRAAAAKAPLTLARMSASADRRSDRTKPRPT